MALRAWFSIYRDGLAYLDFYRDEQRLRVSDDPEIPGYEPSPLVSFYWDGNKLESGEREFVGLEVGNIEQLYDEDLQALDSLQLPAIDVPELGLFDVSPSDVFRRARAQTLETALT